MANGSWGETSGFIYLTRFACSLLRQETKQIIINLETPHIKALEINMRMNRCASIICCRSSPKQKALVMRMVKTGTENTILAIGDGANDVEMFQEACICIRISSVEGIQAVRSSNIVVAQFRYLESLVLFHGHWCYSRISFMESRRRQATLWLTESVLQLGPMFIKLGQFSLSRSDLFPREFLDELSKLEDRVPEFSAEKAIKLATPISLMRKEFEDCPIAAATLGTENWMS